jgi:hypothetical protein
VDTVTGIGVPGHSSAAAEHLIVGVWRNNEDVSHEASENV